MESEIITFITDKKWNYIPITCKTDLELIYDFFKKSFQQKKQFIEETKIENYSSIVYLYFGVFSEFSLDIETVIKFYLLSANLQNVHSMFNLGKIY